MHGVRRRCHRHLRHEVRESSVQGRAHSEEVAPARSTSLKSLGWKMVMFYLPALFLDTFLSMLDAVISSFEASMPERKAGKPTVIILE